MTDALRPNHEFLYHPGEANLCMADAVIINKIESGDAEDVAQIRKTLKRRIPKQ